MPISETGRLTDRPGAGQERRAGPGTRAGAMASGFTLIELVVVVTIVSILSMTMIIGAGSESLFGGTRSGETARTAQALQDAVTTARSRAFHARQPHGLLPLPQGWVILARDAGTGDWQEAGPVTDAAIAGWTIDGSTHIPAPDLSTITPQTRLVPRVIFATDGRSTPFSASLSDADTQIGCETDGWEALQCSRR